MSKGARREREARSLYEQAGYQVQPFYGRQYGETDGFGLFDLLAVQPGEPVRFVQVKSNRARGIEGWVEECRHLLPVEYAQAEYLVCHDREGWRLLQPEGLDYKTVVDEREAECEMGEQVVEYLER